MKGSFTQRLSVFAFGHMLAHQQSPKIRYSGTYSFTVFFQSLAGKDVFCIFATRN